MSTIKKSPRWLLILMAAVILAILVWVLSVYTDFLYYGIGIAIIIIIGLTVAVYRTRRTSSGASDSQHEKSGESKVEEETINVVEADTDSATTPEENSEISSDNTTYKPNASEVAARYRQMAEELSRNTDPTNKPPISELIQPVDTDSVARARKDGAEEDGHLINEYNEITPSLPLFEDESILTEEDKIELLNAVWYRCENPFCKVTNFLSVHHIVEEKEGGTNKLDNLIVLCPYCHDLAHKNEIPVKEMHNWISNRVGRFKTKLEWRY